MRTIQRWSVTVLAMLLLIGLPASVRSADTVTPMIMTAANEYDPSEPQKFMITFSENVKDPRVDPITLPNVCIGIYRGAGTETYYYSWDEQNDAPLRISSTSTAECNSMAQWPLANMGHRGNATGTKLMGDINGLHYYQILSLYRKIAARDAQARLVVRFMDDEGTTSDGYIDAIESSDQGKKLKADSTINGLDNAELELVHYQSIAGVELYDGYIMLHFSEAMSRNLGVANYRLGLYQDGVWNELAGVWTISPVNLRYYGEDKTTLCVDFSKYDELISALNQYDGHEIGLMIQSLEMGIDGVLSDVRSSENYAMIANTTVNGVDATYCKVDIAEEEKLFISDAKLYGNNQVMVIFNKPISSATNHFVGLSIYRSKTDNAMMAYHINEDGSYEYDTVSSVRNQGFNPDSATSEWKRAQWVCSVAFDEPIDQEGTHFLVDVSGNYDQILHVIYETGYDLRLRIQEKDGAGSANGMVDTIWSAANEKDKLLSVIHDNQLDQTWCSVSEWFGDIATIGEKTYASLADALSNADIGDTISLTGYARMDMVVLPAGITLDLNGHILACDIIIGFGQMKDCTEGTGALVIERDGSAAYVHLQHDNPYFPIYDTAVGGYRFFGYSIRNVGTKVVDSTRVKYGIKVQFNALDAYRLLADDTNADIQLLMDMEIGYTSLCYRFNHSIFEDLYQTIKKDGFSRRDKYAIALTIKGLPEDGNRIYIKAKPILQSAQTVESCGITIAYEGEYDSYTRAKAWIAEQINNNTLFSFTYDGVAYADHMNENNWTRTVAGTDTEWIVTYTHKEDNVVAWSEIAFDPETASVEWTNYFRNDGNGNSPIISDVRAMDSMVTVEDPILTSANGSTAMTTDFQPFSVDLTQTTEYVGKMKTSGGRSSQGAFPYFDISNGEYGIIGGIGWTGNWNANFVNDNGNITIDTGMQRVSTYLENGEQMRTPMMMIQFFSGDQDDGHNALRKLMLKSYTPLDETGRPIDRAMLSVGVVNWAGHGEEEMLKLAKNLDSANSKYEALWIDAGWFGNTSGDTLSDDTWIRQVGNWYFIPEVYNDNDGNGIRDIQQLSQYLQERDKELILWFEPERVYSGTELYGTWGTGNKLLSTGSLLDRPLTRLWNFANDDACNEMINRIDTIIKENNVTWYRQDFNVEPEVYWSNADSSDRIGMTEIKYITNLYRYLDALVERNPGLMIDNCAAGGRRLDLEMMKRSVPLWNSDYGNDKQSTPDGIRAVNYNLSWWLPIHAGSWANYNSENTTYAFRADMNSGMQLDSTKAMNSWVQTLTSQYFTCRELMSGDYYILAGGKGAGIETEDACYEFYKPEKGKGYLVAFRPENCTTESATYKLKGLDARATYELKFVDANETLTMTGEQLMTEGLSVTYSQANLSLLVYINKK